MVSLIFGKTFGVGSRSRSEQRCPTKKGRGLWRVKLLIDFKNYVGCFVNSHSFTVRGHQNFGCLRRFSSDFLFSSLSLSNSDAGGVHFCRSRLNNDFHVGVSRMKTELQCNGLNMPNHLQFCLSHFLRVSPSGCELLFLNACSCQLNFHQAESTAMILY